MSSLANYETSTKLDKALDKQLDKLFIQLKDIIRVGTPYRVYDLRCACPMCGCMLGVNVDDKAHCLRCGDVRWWTQDVKNRVSEVMKSYPEHGKHERKKVRG